MLKTANYCHPVPLSEISIFKHPPLSPFEWVLQNYFFKHLRLSDRNVRPTIKLTTTGRTDILVCPNSCATPTRRGN